MKSRRLWITKVVSARRAAASRSTLPQHNVISLETRCRTHLPALHVAHHVHPRSVRPAKRLALARSHPPLPVARKSHPAALQSYIALPHASVCASITAQTSFLPSLIQQRQTQASIVRTARLSGLSIHPLSPTHPADPVPSMINPAESMMRLSTTFATRLRICASHVADQIMTGDNCLRYQCETMHSYVLLDLP